MSEHSNKSCEKNDIKNLLDDVKEIYLYGILFHQMMVV